MTILRSHGHPLTVLLIALLILVPAAFAKYDNPAISERDLTKRKESCYMDIDTGLWGRGCRSSHIVRENCALRCVSAACYNAIYGEDPLEEGEVDYKRGREYRQCIRKELQEERRAQREQAA